MTRSRAKIDLLRALEVFLAAADSGDTDGSLRFLRETSLGFERAPGGFLGFLHSWLATSRHLWMWDYASLRRALITHGFDNVRRCQFGDSSDSMFALVEDRGRFEGALAIEAQK